jgi:hypothetical protein
MKWFIFVVVLAAILVIFGLVYAITGAVNKRKRPKYKTTAPDDDPMFLRDLAEKLKTEDTEPKSEEPKPPTKSEDPNTDEDKPGDK